MIPKKDYIIPRAREVDMVPEIWNGISQTHPNTKKWHGIVFSGFYNMFIDRKYLSAFPKKEWEKISRHLLKKFIGNPKYFNEIKHLHKKYGLPAQNLAQKVSKRVNNDLI